VKVHHQHTLLRDQPTHDLVAVEELCWRNVWIKEHKLPRGLVQIWTLIVRTALSKQPVQERVAVC
jgi:hypothetical protein